MTTIFTDNFSKTKTYIELNNKEFNDGFELVLSTEKGSEIQLILSEKQCQDLVDELLAHGFESNCGDASEEGT